MNNDHENVEIMDEESIITLYDEDENPVEFYEVACVDYEGKFYALLDPVEEMEGVEDGEVFIFEVQPMEDGEDNFLPVEDEALLDAVFAEYVKKAEADGCCCGCEDCDGNCEDAE